MTPSQFEQRELEAAQKADLESQSHWLNIPLNALGFLFFGIARLFVRG